MSRHVLAKMCAAIFWVSVVLFGGCYFIPVPQATPEASNKRQIKDVRQFVVDIDGAVHHLRDLPTDTAQDAIRDWAVYGTLIHLQLDPEAIAQASKAILPARSRTLADSLPVTRGPGRLAVVGNGEDAAILVFLDNDDPEPGKTIAAQLASHADSDKHPEKVAVFRVTPDITNAEILIERISAPDQVKDDAHTWLDAPPNSISEYATASLGHTLTSHPVDFLTAGRRGGRGGGRSTVNSSPGKSHSSDSSYRSSSDSSYRSSSDSSYHSTSSYSKPLSPHEKVRSAPWTDWSFPAHPRHAKPVSHEFKGLPRGGGGGSASTPSVNVTISQPTTQQIVITETKSDQEEESLAVAEASPGRVTMELRRKKAGKTSESPSSSAATPNAVEQNAELAAQKTLQAVRSGDAEAALVAMGKPSVDSANALHDLLLKDANAHLKSGDGSSARSLYDFAADIEGNSSPQLELRRALAEIQAGRPQSGISRIKEVSNLSADDVMLIEGTPKVGDLPDFIAATEHPSETIFGVSARELELVADSAELRTALKIKEFPKGESISMTERAALVAAPGDTVFYIDDRISLNRHDLEMGSQGKLAEVANMPDVTWEAVVDAGERYLPGILVHERDGVRQKRVSLDERPGEQSTRQRVHIRYNKPLERCDADHNGIVSDDERRACCDTDHDGIVSEAERRVCPVAGAPG